MISSVLIFFLEQVLRTLKFVILYGEKNVSYRKILFCILGTSLLSYFVPLYVSEAVRFIALGLLLRSWLKLICTYLIYRLLDVIFLLPFYYANNYSVHDQFVNSGRINFLILSACTLLILIVTSSFTIPILQNALLARWAKLSQLRPVLNFLTELYKILTAFYIKKYTILFWSFLITAFIWLMESYAISQLMENQSFGKTYLAWIYQTLETFKLESGSRLNTVAGIDMNAVITQIIYPNIALWMLVGVSIALPASLTRWRAYEKK